MYVSVHPPQRKRKVYTYTFHVPGAAGAPGHDVIKEYFVLSAERSKDKQRFVCVCARDPKHRWLTDGTTETLHWRARLVFANEPGRVFRAPWEYDTSKIVLGQAKCPECGSEKTRKRTAIKGTFNAKIKCDARCQNAVSEDCSCSCGGLMHGVARTVGNLVLDLSLGVSK